MWISLCEHLTFPTKKKTCPSHTPKVLGLFQKFDPLLFLKHCKSVVRFHHKLCCSIKMCSCVRNCNILNSKKGAMSQGPLTAFIYSSTTRERNMKAKFSIAFDIPRVRHQQKAPSIEVKLNNSHKEYSLELKIKV